MAASRAFWRFWIDTGGTFTDCLACDPEGGVHRVKVLSSSALRGRLVGGAGARAAQIAMEGRVPAGFFRGFRFSVPGTGEPVGVLDWEPESGMLELGAAVPWLGEVPSGALCELLSPEEAPILAARLIVGAGLDQRLPPLEMCLGTTRGTNALLEGKAAEAALFISEGFGDLLRIGTQQRPDLFALRVEKPAPLHGPIVEVRERMGADGVPVAAPDLEAVEREAERLFRNGVTVAAVCLLNSYRNPAHERALRALLRRIGFVHISCSADLAPFIKLLPRAETTVVDASLSPVMEAYLDRVAAQVSGGTVRVMTSAGGLVLRDAYRPKDGLLSGPAGGVVGSAAAGRRGGRTRLIGFDMGGTSTDVSRFDGEFDYVFQHRVGRAQVFAPALKIETVAAGGGSICGFDGSALFVGPESAGASPGSACYGAGGPLTLTDVNLLSGRLDASRFGVPVFPERAEQRLEEVRRAIQAAGAAAPSPAELLAGFLTLADERMADAIRKISVREGYDPSDYTLVAFGGAGGLHACGVASRLGIRSILHPADAGLLSARGLREALIERIAERQILRPLAACREDLAPAVEQLRREALEALAAEGLPAEACAVRAVRAELRFAGQESALPIDWTDGDFSEERFREAYRALFGYCPAGKPVELVALRVIASTRRQEAAGESFSSGTLEGECVDSTACRYLPRGSVRPGERIPGPAVVQDGFSTCFIAAGWQGVSGSRGTLLVERAAGRKQGDAARRPRLVELELFTHRLGTIVEEMGTLLQRTALSTNVKERLDFSCAVLDRAGNLVVNAPHIPVHLGALGLCVRRLLRAVPMRPGDTIVTNHPAFGGSHLPDVTLVTPVFARDGSRLGFVANRAHHAELGGIRPGSMPPRAANLAEEGVVIAPVRLVREGTVEWEAVTEALTRPPYPTRSLEENLADLNAQLAANLRGARALEELAASRGADRARAFMRAIKARAAAALAARLAELPQGVFTAQERLDDGTLLRVKVVNEQGRLAFDFTGSGPVHPGNLNATPAVVRSAIIYVLRLLVRESIPLNEGLMRRVSVKLPHGLLNPRFGPDPGSCPAVVGGNVETSQRLVDTLLKALRVAACSQGTMNNVIFGDGRLSYYETIGGGCGAGPGWDGAGAVHSHMTNTAITDPEILEFRYPVRLERFAIRRGSGGAGRHRGGDGIVREFLFRAPVALSVLTQHRTVEPYGLDGGEPGLCGRQRIIRADGAVEKLASVDQRELQAGDRLIIETPGGGGYGSDGSVGSDSSG